ncbi:MAG: peptidase dimerization domain-containing protein, partial [Candidatus Methanomethylicia archaeon]
SDNALYLMSLIVKRLYECEPPTYKFEIVEESFKKIFKHFAGFLGSILASMIFSPLRGLAFKLISKFEPNMVNFIKSLMGMTIAPTIVRSGEKENVIPSSAEITVNCRLLPGQDDGYVKSVLKEVLKGFEKVDINVLSWFPASYSPIDSAFFNVMESTLKLILPGYDVSIAPFVMPGSSDSRFLRGLGANVYGFSLLNPKLKYSELMNLAHGVNERIDVESLILSTKYLTLLPLKLNF